MKLSLFLLNCQSGLYLSVFDVFKRRFIIALYQHSVRAALLIQFMHLLCYLLILDFNQG